MIATAVRDDSDTRNLSQDAKRRVRHPISRKDPPEEARFKNRTGKIAPE